jgi:hypothetical protein
MHRQRLAQPLDRVPIVRLLERDDVGVLLAQDAFDRGETPGAAVEDVPREEAQRYCSRG